MKRRGLSTVISIVVLLCAMAPVSFLQVAAAAGATTSVHIVKYATDGTTVLVGRTVDHKWMESNLPVQGDGVTHYYHQGPVFQGDMWDPDETTNLKDKGAVKGTDIKDLCDLVGGMSPGDEVMVVAVDGYYLEFPYENVYEPQDRQGSIVLCWYKSKDPEANVGYGYPGSSAYSSAMQIVFFAKTTNGDGEHVFGNSDMRACLTDKKYQHFYEGLPSTDGLSGKWISEIRIYSAGAPISTPVAATPQSISESSGAFPVIPVALGCAGLALVGAAGAMYLINRKTVNKV
jgi:hypothetical protein